MKTLKYLLVALLLGVSASAQNVPMARADGTNITNPSFRDAVLSGTNVSATELGYLDGVTSAIQTQLNAKLGTSATAADVNPAGTSIAAALAGKLTNSMATNKLLGRGTAGTGTIEEITLGTNLTLSGTTLNAAGGTVDNAAVNSAIAENESATAQALGSYVSNVRHYGAVGDGTTDDTNAINLASIALNAAGGGILYFPRGTYMVRQSTGSDMTWSGSGAQAGPRPCFQVFSNMVVCGDGPGITIIRHQAGTTAGPMIHINTASRTTFKDFTLDGNYTVSEGSLGGGDYEGIDTKNDCRDLRFENIVFTQFGNEGIDFDYTAYDMDGFRFIVRDCIFENILGDGIHNINYTLVENSTFRNCGMGRRFAAEYGNSGASGNGAIDGLGENVVIRNCYFADNYRAVHMYASIGGYVQATGKITLTGNPSTGETVTVGGQAYTWSGAAKPVTCNAATDVFTSVAHGFTDDTPVRFVVLESGSGVLRGVTYYIRDQTADTFKLAATVGGTAIDMSANIAAGSWISSDWPTTNEVPIGTTFNDTASFLNWTINGLFPWADANATARSAVAAPSLATGSPAVILVTAIPFGTAGNAVALTEASSNLTVSGAGVLAGGATRDLNTLRLENCVIENNQNTQAIGTLSVDNVVISGCTIRSHGLAIDAAGDGLRVENCEITQSFKDGPTESINVVGASAVIAGNRITGASIKLHNANAVVSNNEITSWNWCIYFAGAGVTNARIIGNYLASTTSNVNGGSNTERTIEVSAAGATAIIQGNVIVSQAQRGISVQSNSIVQGNIVSGAISHAVYLVGSGNTVSGNRLSATGSYGVTADGTGNVITGNWFSGPAGAVNNVGINNVITGNYGSGSPIHTYRASTPEGAVTAPIGSTCINTATGDIYRKTSGTGNTGWVTP